jgi:TonB family protein
MHLKEEEKNIITGILGTVAVHLLVLIVFLIARIDRVRDIHQEPMVIEFDEELYKTLEQIMKENQPLDSKVEDLSQADKKNIAVNTANQLEKQISTEKYIEELKQELDIDEINKQLDRSLGDDPVLTEEPQKEEIKEKNIYKGPTRIEYDLGGRGHRYIYRPIYKCQGSGKVIVAITVDPEGKVIDAKISSTNTNEICIQETALTSAQRSLFEIDLNADPKQRGTISYEFVAQ